MHVIAPAKPQRCSGPMPRRAFLRPDVTGDPDLPGFEVPNLTRNNSASVERLQRLALTDPAGRPVPVLAEGRPIAELI